MLVELDVLEELDVDVELEVEVEVEVEVDEEEEVEVELDDVEMMHSRPICAFPTPK